MAFDLLNDALEQSSQFSELCSALYEREINHMANQSLVSKEQLQAKLKSLNYYVKRAAGSMLAVNSPLLLDIQNASWSEKQSTQLPIKDQRPEDVLNWYQNTPLNVGLVIPILISEQQYSKVIIDSIDRVDYDNQRFRSNYCGWFSLKNEVMHDNPDICLLKPNKKVLAAACSGHQWKGGTKTQTITLSLRELLLSCQINWRNLRRPILLK